jgi:hypothetical protein
VEASSELMKFVSNNLLKYTLGGVNVKELYVSLDNFIANNINEYLSDKLFIKTYISDDDIKLEEQILGKYYQFPLDLNVKNEHVYRYLYDYRGYNLKHDNYFFKMSVTWESLIENEDSRFYLGGLIKYYKKYKFVNSEDAIHQTIDRLAYLRKAYDEFMCTMSI